jgi:hypothetical protein
MRHADQAFGGCEQLFAGQSEVRRSDEIAWPGGTSAVAFKHDGRARLRDAGMTTNASSRTERTDAAHEPYASP